MNIYQAIKDDHDIQRDLCSKLKDTEKEGASARKKAFQNLKKELEVHAIAEERHFYKPLLDTDKMQEEARHGIAEHHEMDELIKKLEDTEADTDTWFSLAKDLCEKVEHHLKDEEKKFFDDAKKIYSEKEEEKLGKEYEQSMKEHRNEYSDSE